MEFLQIQPDTHVYEGELEQALIDHLQHFLLELGRGFSFVARQKRFTLDGQDFFIDLVFYNYYSARTAYRHYRKGLVGK
ncbi:hypothetical protein C810_00633 [Lachnospiraceae bacterium A2]|nr:hypothetical protein C810_00633 [Lachnospiraceae bacterium A2]